MLHRQPQPSGNLYLVRAQISRSCAQKRRFQQSVRRQSGRTDFFNTIGRSPPVVTTACAGQVECKRLISTNAIDWSVTMQMGGQVHAITQAHIKNRQTTTRPWKATGLQGLPALSIGATAAPKIRLTSSRTSAKPELYKRCPRQHPGSQNL
ncbi:hypothetical protein D3C77_361900 [compost metagenome]